MAIPAATSKLLAVLILSPTLTLLLIVHHASAVMAPNMSSCNTPSQFPVNETLFSCCAPSPASDLDPLPLFRPNFSSPPSSSLRMRRPAHGVDATYAEKLARGYQLMQALPADDPRSFTQQANIHCAYCNKVYNRMNSSELFQVHGSWLFFPFHRWYLYFHERILAKLLGDDDFALTFWNYDHPDGAPIPWLFSSYNDTLTDVLRDPHHDASAPAAIDYTWDTDARLPQTQLRENDNAMFRSLIRDATSQELFFGAGCREGEAYPTDGYGTVELMPHNTIHFWVGQKSQVGWKDMGTFYPAARDPLFYAHHALIDRLWEVWKTLPNNYDIDDEDYLNAEFAFYNEDAVLVRVKVVDALNTSNLGYMYEEVENPWMQAVPVKKSEGEAKLTEDDTMCVEGETILKPCSIVMERKAEKIVKGEVGEYMEITIERELEKVVHLDVYINLPSANAHTDSGCEEYFTFFDRSPEYMWGDGRIGKENYTFTSHEMSGRLEALNLTEATSLILTLVPRVLNTSLAPVSVYEPSLIYRSLLEKAFV